MKRKLGIILFILVAFLFTLDSCMQFRMSTSEIDKRFQEKKTKGTQVVYRIGKRKMHYAITGNEDGPLILFVHGSPGSLSDFIGFLTDSTLQQEALLISVDRPGFGQSNFGWAEPSLEKQAELIKPLILEHKKNRPLILVGHSLGGPLIARMVMDYPELIDGLIFVAGSVDPELEPENWWRAPFVTPFLRWMIPRSIRASNDEIYPLKSELKDMLNSWSGITKEVIVIHGTKDSLVPFGNSIFIKNRLTNSKPIMVEEAGMDHFVPWSHPHLIKKAILDMLSQIKQDDVRAN